MDTRLFFLLALIVIFPIGTSYGETAIISVETDDNSYDEGDTILISGNISTLIGNTQVTMQIFKEGNMIEIAQIQVAQDGNYSHTVLVEGKLWKNAGEYLVKATYGEGNIAETSFTFTPQSEMTETTDTFIVLAGDSGTFDIPYIIRGGILEDIKIEPNILGLVVSINALDEGTLVLDLPRQYIDSEKQNGKDEEFIILIDDVQTTYAESNTYSDFRTISIDFEKNDRQIEIIGTYVIPEFGTIVMIILTVGILSSVLLTRNRFQIKI